MLFLIESCYLALKAIHLKSTIPKYKFKVMMCSLSSMLRLCFIATFFIYEEAGSPLIMNLIHYDIVCLYLICWMVEAIHDIFAFLLDVKEAISITITRRCRHEKPSHHKG